MSYMFEVRSPRALPRIKCLPSLFRCLRRSRLALLLPHIVYPPCDSRQHVTAFNQPLSLDTSKVTGMRYMFSVRTARALCPQPSVAPPHACRLRPRRLCPSPPPGAHFAPHRRALCHLSTRQDAVAFNQPLSLDTSSVTDMNFMFFVRSAYGPTALRPNLHSGLLLHATCAAVRRSTRPPGPHTPRPAWHVPSFRLGRQRTRSTSR